MLEKQLDTSGLIWFGFDPDIMARLLAISGLAFAVVALICGQVSVWKVWSKTAICITILVPSILLTTTGWRLWDLN
jgi:hypothetical protein